MFNAYLANTAIADVGFFIGLITLTKLIGYNSGPFICYQNKKTIIPMIPAPVIIEGTASVKTSDHLIFTSCL